MRRFSCILIFLYCLNSLFAQSPDSISIICPSQSASSDLFPIVLKLYKNGTINYSEQNYILNFNNANSEEFVVKVEKGIGSLCTVIEADGDFEIEINNFNNSKNIIRYTATPTELSGTISTDFHCDSNTIYTISTDLTIGNSVDFVIDEGVQFLISENVNIICNGKISCNATTENPVVFKSLVENLYWGGITINSVQDTSIFEGVFFVKGGGNTDFIFGHSLSQPVLKADHGNMICENCYFIDNAGKALGGNISNIALKSCLISRCDTGGEFYMSKVIIDSCYIMFIPDDNGVINDDDNDGLYFNGVHPSNQESTVSNSFFVTGEDDGIDHNGAKLRVENCWIENFYHEGIACSNSNYLNVFNSFIRNCGQAIEAGYGSPHVLANHCVFIENIVGARFGDDYEQPSTGKMEIKNSIFFNNTDNIYNFEPQIGGPVEDSLVVSFSITNDVDFNNQNSCIEGQPLFSEQYLLEGSSPGIAAADDGLDMGLVGGLTYIPSIIYSAQFSVYPNPASDYINIEFFSDLIGQSQMFVTTFSGQTIISEDFELDQDLNHFGINVSFLNSGIYMVVLVTESGIFTRKLIVYD